APGASRCRERHDPEWPSHRQPARLSQGRPHRRRPRRRGRPDRGSASRTGQSRRRVYDVDAGGRAMIGDITTVMTKEWREFFSSGGDRRSGLIVLFIIAAVLGVYLPFRMGQAWITSPFMVLSYSIYLPLILVINTIADSIAGERERHTLETLLASRLSDRAIILGKLGAVVGYSLAFSVGTSLVAIVVINLKAGGPFQFYPSDIFT